MKASFRCKDFLGVFLTTKLSTNLLIPGVTVVHRVSSIFMAFGYLGLFYQTPQTIPIGCFINMSQNILLVSSQFFLIFNFLTCFIYQFTIKFEQQ